MKDGADAMKNSWISLILVVGVTSAVLLPGYAYADVRVNDEDGVASTVADGTEFSNSDPLQELLHQKYEEKPSRSADHPLLGLPKFLKETFLYGYEDVKRNERQAWPADRDVRGRTYPNQRQPRTPNIAYRAGKNKQQQHQPKGPTKNYHQPPPNHNRGDGYKGPSRGNAGKGGKGNKGKGGGSSGRGKLHHKPGRKYNKNGRSSSGRKGHNKGRGRGSRSGIRSGSHSNGKYHRKRGRNYIKKNKGYRGSSSGSGGKNKYKRRKHGKSSSKGKKYRHHSKSKSKSRKGRKGKHGKKGRRHSGSKSNNGSGSGYSNNGKHRRRKYHIKGGSGSNDGSYDKGSNSGGYISRRRPHNNRPYGSGSHSGGGSGSNQNGGGPHSYRDKYRQVSSEEQDVPSTNQHPTGFQHLSDAVKTWKETYSKPSYGRYTPKLYAARALDIDEEQGPEEAQTEDAVTEPEEVTTTIVDPFLMNWDEDVRE